MDFKRTREFVYRNCVNRVERKRLEMYKPLPQCALCRDDPSLVSDFFNCKCTSNNKYLVTKRLINFNDEKKGIVSGAVPILGFTDEFKVLWGDDKEFNDNLYSIFCFIMKDIIDSGCEYVKDINTVLCDHIIYSKYSTLLHIKKVNDISLLKYFAVYDDTVSPENMEKYLDSALRYLYSKNGFCVSFKDIFNKYALKYKDYKFFDNRLESCFLPSLMLLLNTYIPDADSLGLRVKKLIELDLIKTLEQIDKCSTNFESTPEFKVNQQIINASSLYIVKLEEIAEQCDKYNIHL